MKKLSDILNTEATSDKEELSQDAWLSQRIEEAKRKVEWSKRANNQKHYKCKLCGDTGWVDTYFVKKGNVYEAADECPCRKTLIASEKIQERKIETSTWDRFKPLKPYHRQMKEKAMRYVNTNNDNWLYIGGQVGSGKTHLSKTIERDLLIKGFDVLFIKWRDKVNEIKALYETSNDIKNRLFKVEYLIIDDFMKMANNERPTDADIKIAFEIIDYRYENKKPTIITSQHIIDDIIKIDEAVGSRIAEMSKPDFLININKNISNNNRL